MKILFSILILFFLNQPFLIAQNDIKINNFPQSYQLIPRNTVSNKGSFTIDGLVLRGSPLSLLKVILTREGIIYEEKSLLLKANNIDVPFSFVFEIKAELSQYSVALHITKGGKDTVIAKAEKLVSGDVYLVNGQSNNIGSIEEVDYSPFLRSYTAKFGWSDIRYTQPGKWAPRFAKLIIDNQKIPVALFNESYGGVKQSYFLKNSSILSENSPVNNYNSAMRRLEEAGVKNKLKAILWWQGESDGWETPSDLFKVQFKQLNSDWIKDYGNIPCYLFQIRFKSCSHVNPMIMEVQRQLGKELPNVEVISTNAALSDGCHFAYTNGYDSLGSRLYRLVASRYYGSSTQYVRSLDIDRIWFSGSKELSISIKNTDKLEVIGNPWSDFIFAGSKTLIDNGSVEGNIIKIRLLGDTTGLKAVSYLSHITPENNWITNPLGLGILSFYNIPITSKSHQTSLNTEGVSKLDIQPTIATDRININLLNIDFKNAHIELYDILGKIHFIKEIQSNTPQYSLETHMFPKGMYWVVLRQNNQILAIQKIIKV